MNRKRILIAEDDANIRQGLEDALESEGYGVHTARNGKDALALCGQESYHCILLDIMMPEMSGYDVCRAIRSKDRNTPILMLTAKGQEIDKVVGLELGADDYVVKPFGVRELLARIAALIRRADTGGGGDAQWQGLPDTLLIGEAEINRKTYELTVSDVTIALTDRELKLLCVLYRHPDEVLSRDFLLNAVWGIDYLGTTRTLDQHVAQIRKKLKGAGEKIETVHGVGYRFRP